MGIIMEHMKLCGPRALRSKVTFIFLSLIMLAPYAKTFANESFLSSDLKGTSIQDSQNQAEAYAHQSLLAPEEELITLFFGSINNRQNKEAVKLLSQNLNPNKETEKTWLEQFNAIKSVHIMDIKEIAKDTWTDTRKVYKVTLEIYVDNSAANAPIPYYGWEDNPNIRFIGVIKLNSRWYIDRIGTGQ
jgi:hypothetical protein